MYIKYFRFLIAILFCAITSCSTVREKPRPATSTGKEAKREFRGAWIQTAFQGEYKDMTPARMKKDFIRKLNYLQACGINAIIFQVRPEADAFYKSDIEPWSRFFTGEQGVAPAGEFDPMAFLIQECHKRNMEFHAWLNPYRASTETPVSPIPTSIISIPNGLSPIINKSFSTRDCRKAVSLSAG